MQRIAAVVAVAVVAGCGGPQPLGPPCPPVIETAHPTIAPAASGGVLVFGSEGLPSGTFVRHFDAAGALAWTVALPDPPSYDDYGAYAVAGDAVFVMVKETVGGVVSRVSAVRDGAIAFAADVPYDCSAQAFAAEGDRLRVYGDNSDNRSCSFRVAADGTFDDPLVFDESVYAMRAAPSGGFVAAAADGVVRYDAAGDRVWTHAGAFIGALEGGDGAVLAFGYDDTQTTLVRLGSDGQGEEMLASFPHQPGLNTGDPHLVPLPTADGAIIVVGHTFADEIDVVRVVPAGLAWSATLTGAPLATAVLGSATLLLHGRRLVTLDLDGNTRFTAPSALDATVGADDLVRTADVKTLDPCRQVLRVSTLDGSGQVQASWSAR